VGMSRNDWINCPFQIIPPEERVIRRELAICKVCERLMKISHVKYQLCYTCAKKSSQIYRMTGQQRFAAWEAKAREKHGDFYDYSKVEYVKSKQKVIIICPIHGEFRQVAKDHYYYGCKLCGIESRAKKSSFNKEQWIQKAKKTHGDKVFDYSLVPEDVKGEDYVSIICSEGHQWNVMFQSHCYRNGCPECYNQRRGETLVLTQEEFITRAKSQHGEYYDLSMAIYVGAFEPIDVICPEHGLFHIKAGQFIYGRGCYKCGRIRIGDSHRLTPEQFITKAKAIHGDKYDYSKVNYTTTQNKITIICPDHGDFVMQANEHINSHKSGCVFCSRSTLHPDDFIQDCIAIHGDRYDLSQIEYTGYHDYITPICPEHGMWKTTANTFLKSNCPTCATYGFKTNKPGYCYLLEYQFSDGIIRYKQGITNNEVKYRVVSLSREVNKVFPETKVTLISQMYFDVGQDALDLENHFKSISEIRWTPEQNFQGSTEMYAEGILDAWIKRSVKYTETVLEGEEHGAN